MTINVYDNYGNILQKYALHKTLKKFSTFTEVLWHYTEHENLPEKFDLPIEADKQTFAEAIRAYKFKEFDRRHIKTRFDIPYIEDTADEYDFFVVGSDQVWNPRFASSEFFLEFVPPKKRIAFAASIASKELDPRLHEIYRQGISNFPIISVREKKSAEIIYQLTGREVETLLDPVFLLTEKEWLKIAQKPSWFNEKYKRGYILAYFFHEFYKGDMNNLSKNINLPVIYLSDKENFDHCVVSPEEFLYLVANATVIFTHSFHGTAFSTLLRRPLFVIEEPGVDVFCHGTPSPLLWESYIAWRSRGHEISHVNFRSKRTGWLGSSFEITFKDCPYFARQLMADIFSQEFLINIILRPSCHACKFKFPAVHSDLSIGDAWGIQNFAQEFFDNRGTSLAVAHTDKGLFILNKTKLIGKQVTLENILPGNPNFLIPPVENPHRKNFFADLKATKNPVAVMQKYFQQDPSQAGAEIYPQNSKRVAEKYSKLG